MTPERIADIRKLLAEVRYGDMEDEVSEALTELLQAYDALTKEVSAQLPGEYWVQLPRVGGIAMRAAVDSGYLLIDKRDDREGLWGRVSRVKLATPPSEGTVRTS